MFNNSGSYGPNDAPRNMVASLNSPQNNATNLSHNMNDIGKYMHQTASSTSGYYEPYNYHNFGRHGVNIPPTMHPFQAYQNMAHESPFMPQPSQFSHENAMQNVLPSVQSPAQGASYSSMLNISQNYHSKTLSDLLSTTFREPSMSKNYPLNVPQAPSTIVQNNYINSKYDAIDHKMTEYSKGQNLISSLPDRGNIITENCKPRSSLNAMHLNDIPYNMTIDHENRRSHELDRIKHENNVIVRNLSKTIPNIEDEMKKPNIITQHEMEKEISESMPINYGDPSKKNLMSNLEISKHQSMKHNLHENILENKPTYKIVNNNQPDDNTLRPLVLKKTLTDDKRQSLEKTVKIIESILINTTNSGKETEDDVANYKPTYTSNQYSARQNIDPLAASPKQSKDNISHADTDSDNEVLSKVCQSKYQEIQKFDIKKQHEENTNCKNDPKLNETQSVPQSKLNEDSHMNAENMESEGNYNTDSHAGKELKIKMEQDDIKVERLSCVEYESYNPFLRDTNGVSREEVGEDVKIIGMDCSVEEAQATVKSGTSSLAYFECPDCQILILDAKRFLIHNKWHNFGLLNLKREELARQREEQARIKREARREERIQRLSATLPKQQVDALRCKDCDILFPTKSSLKTHRTRVHPMEITECKVCHIPIRDLRSLKEHLVTHENKEAGGHQCPHCPKRFKYRHSLTKHVDTHLEKTESCPICNKLFGSTALVKRHLVTHERQARTPGLSCSYCGKAFYEAYHLRVHERIHRNDRPFKCETCHSSFVSNSGLQRHLKVSHSLNQAKPFACPVCKKCFSTSAICARHELRFHTDQAMLQHQCNICGTRFMKHKDMKTHMQRKHGIGLPRKRRCKKEEDHSDNYDPNSP